MSLSRKRNRTDKDKELEDDEIVLEEGEVGQSGEHQDKRSRTDFVGMALHDIDKYRTIYFEGVDSGQVNEVLDDLKGIDVRYEVGQVMHDGFTKVMSVVLSAEDADRVTKARELVEKCYGGPGRFCPERAYDEKEVARAAMAIRTVKSEGDHVISNDDFVKAVKELTGADMPEDFEMARIAKAISPTWIVKCREQEILTALIDKGGATINYNDYYFQPWRDFNLKPIVVNIKPVPPQVKPSELRTLVHKLSGVRLLDLEFVRRDSTYQGFVKGVVATEQDLLTLIDHTGAELFIGCPLVSFRRQMSKEEFEKTREKRERSQTSAASYKANRAAQDATRRIEQAKQSKAIELQEARAREAASAMQRRIQERIARAAARAQDP